MKKILFVCNTSWGMMMFRAGLLKRLVKEGYEVVVLAPRDSHSGEIEALGAQYVEVAIDNKGSNIFKDMMLMRRLTQHYKALSPDLIFHYTIKPNIYGTLAAKKAKVKSIAVITGLGYTFINNSLTAKVAKKLYKYALPQALKVWFINHEDRKKFIKEQLLSRELMEILPGEGVDMEHYAPREKRPADGKFIFVLIARLLWDKGVGEFVKAAKEIREKYPHAEFWLVGFVDAKNPSAISKEQIDYWEQQGFVHYKGSTDDVREFIAHADCVVLPSYREGISKILLESASMAKPIIASNVPGCHDIVEHTISGYLCKVKNATDLAHKMEKMLSLSDEEQRLMGEKGRAHVMQEFDEKIVIERYLHAIAFHTVENQKYNFNLTSAVH